MGVLKQGWLASREDYRVAALPSELNLTNISFPNNKGRAQRETKHLLLIITLKPCSCIQQPRAPLAALLLVEPSGKGARRKQVIPGLSNPFKPEIHINIFPPHRKHVPFHYKNKMVNATGEKSLFIVRTEGNT